MSSLTRSARSCLTFGGNPLTMHSRLRALLGRYEFLGGLLLRLGLIVFAVPAIDARWFVPFLQSVVLTPALDPWQAYLSAGGDPLAFPYGPVMLLSLLPGVGVATAAAGLTGTSLAYAGAVGLGFGLLLADLAILAILLRLMPERDDGVLWFYWLSPIVLYTAYWHGQLDLVPVAFLLLSLLLLRQLSATWSGVVMGAAIAAKLSMLLALPFIIIYLARNNRLRKFAPGFLVGLAVSALVLQGTPMLSPGVRAMVSGTPEAQKVLDVVLPINGMDIYLLPLAYLIVVYAAWRVRRMSFHLLLSLLGLGFFLVLLLTPASPGWFVWVVPFLVVHQISAGGSAVIISSLFSLVYFGFQMVHAEGSMLPVFDIDAAVPWAARLGLEDSNLSSLWLTGMTACGIVLAVNMAREGVQRNDYFRLSRRPLVIGIAGDSGTGKDTLALALEGVFGRHSVARLSGDDYHLWDRQKPMWQAITHLNPRANDLEKFNSDALALADGRSILVRHYDHSLGKYVRPTTVRHNDVVIVSGLHALYPPRLRRRYDLRIYLDMDEGLRRAFKMHRDVNERGHSPERVTSSINERLADAKRFIFPQSTQADIVLQLAPACPDDQMPENPAAAPLQLRAKISHGLYLEDLTRVFVGICGLRVDFVQSDNGDSVNVVVDGDINGDDLSLAARRFLPHVDEMIDTNPVFDDGMTGAMQFIVLAHAAQAMRERLA